MKLKKILKNILVDEVKGPREIEVTGICSDSKLVAPGNVFVAKKGHSVDGSQFIPEAVEAGAVAVVTDIYNPFIPHVTQVMHPHPEEIEGELAATFHQFPSNDLFTVGITGTNGKTTTASMTRYLLEQIKGPCGLIGTIEYILGSHRHPATRTTPEAPINHKMLKEMVNHGCQSAVMEVTSHALDQRRIDFIDFDIAVFTNLTQDHLDYHQTMEKYCEAKQALFTQLSPTKTAIVNKDDPWYKKILKHCQAKIFTYSIDCQADLTATNIELGASGSIFDLTYRGETSRCHSPFIGRFNIYNVLAAVAIALACGAPLEKISQLIKEAPFIPGRLEPIPNELGIHIFVDFAHTPDALSQVLETLREMQQKKIITVFGCGGDRDKGKRPEMAAVSEKYSNLTIVTSDNPRTEKPESITEEIVKGFKDLTRFSVELDRHQAISQAIKLADVGDIVLIAGKGHEPYQILNHRTIAFDDRAVVAELCKQHQPAPC